MKNKSGQTIIYLLMMGILFFFIGLALAPSLRDVVSETMQDNLLNCSTTTDTQTKIICTSIDMTLPLFIGIIFGLAGVIIGGIAVR